MVCSISSISSAKPPGRDFPYGAHRGLAFNTITAKHFREAPRSVSGVGTGQYHEYLLPNELDQAQLTGLWSPVAQGWANLNSFQGGGRSVLGTATGTDITQSLIGGFRVMEFWLGQR